jgi:hypothetical protein
MGRLGKLVRCYEFQLPPRSVSPLVDQLITELDSNPVSSDQFINFLMFADLSEAQVGRLIDYATDDARSIYSWQNYLLWRLFAARKVRSGTLIRYAFNQIRNQKAEEADLAGAALYIGAVGNARTRIRLARQFHRFQGFIDQRSALVAIHEVPWAVVKDTVKPHVLGELTGVYQRLHKDSKFTGQYMKLPDSLKLSELFDSLGSENVS